VDRVCILSKDVGNACPEAKASSMFFFDKDQERCQAFTFLGCGGNENKFESQDDCIDSCQVPFLLKKEKNEDASKKTQDPHQKSDCKLEPVSGPCKAIITMWYFNTGKKRCETFGYGGCNGNGNKFDARLECETYCGDDSKKNT
jgi:hypothetical protein